MEALGEVSRLGVGHGAETADETTGDDALLASKDADLETGVLWSFEDLVAMEAVERLGCVFARDGVVDEDGAPAWVEAGEAGEIVDLCVYDDPLRREGWGWVGECMRISPYTVGGSSGTYQVTVLVVLRMCHASESAKDLQPSDKPYLLNLLSRELLEIVL